MVPIQIDFSKYHRYEELVQHLRELVEAYPGLSRMYSLGKSYEGRELWLVEVTNHTTGDHNEKPGYYVDANMHAGEVTGATTALYTIWHLLTEYGRDAEVTRLVDTTSFYILPRVSPDGAEQYLTTPTLNLTLRSSVRPYPVPQEEDGLYPEDMDGDGMILQMRVPDRDGEWKVSTKDTRLMIPRRPDEVGGEYFRLYIEGRIHNYDGVEIKVAPSKTGLDLNRNFPADWQPEAKQKGAGPYPLSEPETRAVAEFLLNQKNIAGGQNYHTYTGIILRPSALRPDDKLAPKDRIAFSAIGRLGQEVTGYPCVGIYDGFAYQKENPIRGAFLDWCYEHLGIMVYSTELWDIRVRAGLDRVPFLTPFKERDEEEEGLRLLGWVDRENGGEGFTPWYDYDHPQLGRVQLGGWDIKRVFQNAPPRYLQAEAHKNCLFTLKHAAASPRIEIAKAAATHLGEGVYKVEVVIRNRGYLPTNVTEMAKQNKVARPVTVELQLPAGADLVLGKVKEELGHLEGRVVAMPNIGVFPGNASVAREKKLEWVVQAPDGGDITVRAVSEKAGRRTATLSLRAEV